MKSVYEVQTWIGMFGEDRLDAENLLKYLNFMRSYKVTQASGSYTEWHHIVPRCIDKDCRFSDCGLDLRGSDHLKAHLMLVDAFKSCPQRRSLAFAVHQMMRDPKGLRKLTLEEYEEARRKYSEGLRGTHMPEESRQRISEVLSDGRLKGEKHPRYGKSTSEETKKRISDGIKEAWTSEKRQEFSSRRTGEGNPCYGKHPQRPPVSDKARKSMSDAGRGKIWITNGKSSTKICPEDELPEGYTYGRSSFSRKTNGQEGLIWINNGTVNKKIPKDAEVPEGFTRGKVKRSHEN